MKSVTYKIPGIHCNHCIHTINMEIGDLEGIESVKTDLDSKSTTIAFEEPATEEKIIEALKEIGYPPELP